MRHLAVLAACLAGSLIFAMPSLSFGQGQDTGNGQTDLGQGGGTDQTGGTGSVAGDPNAQFQQEAQDLSGAFNANTDTFQNTRGEGGFVGADEEAIGSVFGANAQAPRGLGGLDGLFQALGGLNQNAGNVRNTRRIIRAPMRLGFAVSRPADHVVSAKYQGRLTQLPMFSDNPNIAASLENRVLTLTGTVPDARQKKMAERLALLEPGISKVNNQLAVIDLD